MLFEPTLAFLSFDMEHMLYVALPMMVLSLIAQGWVKSAYHKYAGIANSRRMSGAQAAYEILHSAGIHDVRVEQSQGWLSDHYSPSEKIVRLSPDNYAGTSLAAVGIAAHEVGHAIQHAHAFAPMVIRNLAVPVANIGSMFGYIAIMIGMFMGNQSFALIGLALLAGILFFQLVNLPVEFDASSRALKLLPSTGILREEEVSGVKSMLTAAAFTYVAATIAAAWELIFWAIRLGLLNNRNDE